MSVEKKGPSLKSLKYNPANFTPDHLFEPPTKGVRKELVYLVKKLEKTLGGLEKEKRLLQVGTELEIFFFSPDSDPSLDKRRSRQNPNYSESHLEKVEKLLHFGEKLHKAFPDQFEEPDDMGRIFLEFRTAPQSPSEYLKTIGSFAISSEGNAKNWEFCRSFTLNTSISPYGVLTVFLIYCIRSKILSQTRRGWNLSCKGLQH